MAIFKCLASGNTVEFTLAHDIASMVGHSGYVRVDEVEVLKKEEDQDAVRDDTMFIPTSADIKTSKRKVSDV
jgi:hypothetical protein